MKGSLACLLVICLAHVCYATLPEGVSLINSVYASYPHNSDLEKFDGLARKAEIFAIGESAHGVAGYQDFEFRLTKYLITHHGYRRVLIEVLSDDRALNTFLTTGQGNLTEILYLNPWQGSDIEMFNFFSWIRSFNVRYPYDLVTVHAPDPQNPWQDSPVIQAFVQLYDAKYNQNLTSEVFANIYDNCFGATFANQIDWAFSPETDAYYDCLCLPDNKTASCVGGINYLEDMVKAEEKSLHKWLGKTYVDDVLYALRSLRSWQLKSATLFSSPYQSARYREPVFGVNALYLAERENHKKSGTVLIAHNLHICKTTLLTTFIGPNPDVDPFFNIHPMGYVLHENLGDKYVAVSQSGYNVSAMFAGQYPIPTSPLSIDVTLHALNHSLLLLDTHAHWVEAQGIWLAHEESVPNGRYYPLKESFDRLVFQDVALKPVFVDAGLAALRKRHSRMTN